MINPSLHYIKGFASKYLSIFGQIDPTGVGYISSKSGEKNPKFLYSRLHLNVYTDVVGCL